eukprot:1160602-Pelagomonas_calceolata.AAC.9
MLAHVHAHYGSLVPAHHDCPCSCTCPRWHAVSQLTRKTALREWPRQARATRRAELSVWLLHAITTRRTELSVCHKQASITRKKRNHALGHSTCQSKASGNTSLSSTANSIKHLGIWF